MAVLKTSSPSRTPGLPTPKPRKTVPSWRASVAVGGRRAGTTIVGAVREAGARGGGRWGREGTTIVGSVREAGARGDGRGGRRACRDRAGSNIVRRSVNKSGTARRATALAGGS